MATAIDLTTIQSGNLGTELVGATANNGAGFSVTDVGDVTGSGFDSYLVAAPSVIAPAASGITGGASNSAVYLVLGTKPVGSTVATGVDNLTAALRAGDLGTLGTTTQVNPTVVPTTPATLGFQFDGLKFVTTLNATTGLGSNSQLGYSVAALGDINGDGYADFMIGAPNDTGGGRAFLVYGGTQLANQTNKTIDLEPTAGTTTTVAPTKVVSFSITGGTTAGNRTGQAVAGIGNFFGLDSGLGNTASDLAIGDPLLAGAGGVYAVSGVRVNALASGTNVDLTTVGATGGIGELFNGVNAGDMTGYSIADAGNFDGTTNGTAAVSSLLIGAPGSPGSSGRAYLIYGDQATTTNLTLGTTQSLSTLGVAPTTTAPITTPLSGVVFLGTSSGARLGYAVSSATDFNSDGLNDIAIGGPGSGTAVSGSAATGFVGVVYGQATSTTGTTTARPNGSFSLDPAATNTAFTSLYLTGEAAGDLAGYSIAPVYPVTSLAGSLSPTGKGLLVGAPGAGAGAAYYLNAFTSGTTGTTGTTSLTSANYRFTATNSAAGSTAFFGASVSGRPIFSDDLTNSTGDLGSPGFSLADPANAATTTRSLDGAEYTVSSTALLAAAGGSTGTGGTGTTTGTSTGTASATGLTAASTFVQANPIFTGQFAGQPSPTLTSLSHLASYQPIPVRLAYQQFRLAPGFAAREEKYHNPGKGDSHQAQAGTFLGIPQLGERGENKYTKKFTIPTKVFRRGKFRIGTATTFTHATKVIPRSQQTESYPG